MKAVRKFSGVALVAVTTVALAACGSDATDTASGESNFGECEITENPPIHELETMTEGVLTVAASLPYPDGYRGNTLADVDGGYMYCLDAEIANRAGLKEIKLVNASFEALITAKTGDFDFAVWDIYDTEERRKAVDFAAPYNAYETGVLVKAGSEVTKDNLADGVVGFLAGAIDQPFVEGVLKPKEMRAFNSNDDMNNALLAGQIDAALNGVATVMPAALASDGRLEVIARIPQVQGQVAPLFPKGSPNVAPVTAILEDMREDGTLDAIMDKWLHPLLGGDPAELPAWEF